MFISAFFIHSLFAYAAIAVPAGTAKLGMRDANEQQVTPIQPATFKLPNHGSFSAAAAAPPHFTDEHNAGLVLASPPASSFNLNLKSESS